MTTTTLSPMRPGISLGAAVRPDWSLPGWSWQPKVNDERAVLNIRTGDTYNRRGELFCARKLIPFGKALEALIGSLAPTGAEWADLGLIGWRESATFAKSRGAIIVFDVPETGAGPAPWSERRELLRDRFPVLDLVAGEIARPGLLYRLDEDAAAGRLFARTLGVAGLEGIVGRNERAPYVQGESREMAKARWARKG